MARLLHLDIPGITQYVVQSAHDLHTCFSDDAACLHYRQVLGDTAVKHGCALHAYVLMGQHVHLLLTPAEAGGVSRMMQVIGRRYMGPFNAYRHTGTLAEGRYRSVVVEGGREVLACYRDIELKPVRAGLVPTPDDYRWSSHHRNARGAYEPRITPHPAYLALGDDDRERQRAYAQLFIDPPADAGIDALDPPSRLQDAAAGENTGTPGRRPARGSGGWRNPADK